MEVWLECSSSYSGCLCGVRLTLLRCGYAMWCYSGVCQDPYPSRICHAVPYRVPLRKLARCLGWDAHSPGVFAATESMCAQLRFDHPGMPPCPILVIILLWCFFIAPCCAGCDQEDVNKEKKNKGGRQATPEDERLPCFSTTRYKSSSMGLNSCS
jgi:hypothetical protein